MQLVEQIRRDDARLMIWFDANDFESSVAKRNERGAISATEVAKRQRKVVVQEGAQILGCVGLLTTDPPSQMLPQPAHPTRCLPALVGLGVRVVAVWVKTANLVWLGSRPNLAELARRTPIDLAGLRTLGGAPVTANPKPELHLAVTPRTLRGLRGEGE
jgi:hypothetical protein